MVQLFMILSFMFGFFAGVYIAYQIIAMGIAYLAKDIESGVRLNDNELYIQLEKLANYKK